MPKLTQSLFADPPAQQHPWLSRKSDPATSHQAAEKVAQAIWETQQGIKRVTCPRCTGTGWLGALACGRCQDGTVQTQVAESMEVTCIHDYQTPISVRVSSGKYRTTAVCSKCGDVAVLDSSD